MPDVFPVSDSAYFVAPLGGPGRGLLLLHSWWGLTPFSRRLADRLADQGYTVVAPDLNFGAIFDEPAAAEIHLGEASADRMALLTLNSARLAQQRSADLSQPILAVEVLRYRGTSHWFFEDDRPEFDRHSAALAWDRLVRFLSSFR